jgi:hypothetical protein
MHDLRPNTSGVVRASTPAQVAERDHIAARVQDRPRRAAGRVVLRRVVTRMPESTLLGELHHALRINTRSWRVDYGCVVDTIVAVDTTRAA